MDRIETVGASLSPSLPGGQTQTIANGPFGRFTGLFRATYAYPVLQLSLCVPSDDFSKDGQDPPSCHLDRRAVKLRVIGFGAGVVRGIAGWLTCHHARANRFLPPNASLTKSPRFIFAGRAHSAGHGRHHCLRTDPRR